MICRPLEESSRRGDEEGLAELTMISFRHPKEDEGEIESIAKGDEMESRALEKVLGAIMGIRDQSELHLAIEGGRKGGRRSHLSLYIPYLLKDICGS